MKLSFFSNKFASDPENAEVDFEALPDLLREVADDDKDTAPLWSPSDMQGGKTEGHTRSVEALSLDFDGVEPPWDQLSAWTYFAHTTHSHMRVCDKNPNGDLPFWRVVAQLDEPADPKTWKDRFKAKMLDCGFEMDRSCCNPNRSFYVPPTNAEWRTNEGHTVPMPTVARAEQVAAPDLDENTDGYLSDGSLFWPAVERMMRVLPKSVSGEGGDDRLFEAACVCRSSFRLTPEASFRALQIFNERCEPPWDDERLWYKIQQAARDVQHPPGELIPEQVKAQLREDAGFVAPEPEKESIAPSELWAPAGAVVALVTRVEYMCKELGIRDGRPSLWTADARCGKSTLASSVALAAAAGTPLWGRLSIRQGPVCYVAGEDIEGVARTWKRLALDQGISIPADLHIAQNFPLAGEGVNKEHLRTLLSHHKLVIFDTLRSLSRMGGIEENDPKFADGLYLLDEVGEGTGCCVIVLHHNNKQGKSNGTAALFGAAGNHLELTRAEETCVTKVFAAGTRDGLSFKPFQVEANLMSCPAPPDDPDSTGIRLVHTYLVGESKVTPNVEKIAHQLFERLKNADRWMPRGELIRDLGKAADITAALGTLERKVGFKVQGQSHMYHWDPKQTPKS